MCAERDTAAEVEITPEMIEAGVSEYSASAGLISEPEWAVGRIYAAMAVKDPHRIQHLLCERVSSGREEERS